MIFVCLGTQTFPFDRLLIKLDELIDAKILKADEVFAQTGTLNYVPRQYKYKQFLSHEEFESLRSKAELIISHGGTGALIGAAKMGKNIIAVPRLAAFGEHVDDHQLQIVRVLEEQGYIRAVYDISKLGDAICEAFEKPIKKVYKQDSSILQILFAFIEGEDVQGRAKSEVGKRKR